MFRHEIDPKAHLRVAVPSSVRSAVDGTPPIALKLHQNIRFISKLYKTMKPARGLDAGPQTLGIQPSSRMTGVTLHSHVHYKEIKARTYLRVAVTSSVGSAVVGAPALDLCVQLTRPIPRAAERADGWGVFGSWF